MRQIILFFFSTMMLSPMLVAQSLEARAELLQKKVRVGDRPCLLLKIINKGKSNLYVDYNEIIVNSGITYSDNSIDFSTIKGRPAYGATDGATLGNIHLGNQTIGIEPGQSFLKLAWTPSLKQGGRVMISLRIHITVTSDLSVPGDKWEYKDLDIELPVTVDSNVK